MIYLTLPEPIYYGKDEINKKQFMKLYKHKSLKLKWLKDTTIDGKVVSGWFNIDKSQYIIKLQEVNHQKRLSFVGCQEIVDFFKSLGAVEFEVYELKWREPILPTEPEQKPTISEIQHFIGADLASHHRTEELLKNMPDNFGVIWK